MNPKLSRYFYAGCVFMLSLPFAIFLLAWVTPFLSLPLVLTGAAGLWHWFRKTEFPVIPFLENRKILLGAFLLAALWVLASGIGGYAYQNFDHYYRNAILKDLVTRDWPVVVSGDSSSPTALVYYFGFFLLPALGGKLFLALGASSGAAMEAAWFLSYLLALGNIFAFYVLVSTWLGRFSLWPMVVLAGFSGLDLIPYLLYEVPEWMNDEFQTFADKISPFMGLRHAPNLEWSTLPWLNSSMTGLLFWVFNQSIASLTFIAFFLALPNHRGGLLFYAMLFLSSPFAAVALFPVMVWQLLRESGFRPAQVLRTLCSPLNLLALPVVLLIALFFQSNVSAGSSGFCFPESFGQWLRLGVYFLTEYGIWLLLLERKWNAELAILLGVVLLTSFVRLGGSNDFAMRTAIPLTIVLMLSLLRRWYAPETTRRWKILFVCVFAIGLATPLMEFKRSLVYSGLTYANEIRHTSETTFFSARPNEPEPDHFVRDERLPSVFELESRKDQCWKNFSGRTDSLFFRYLSR